MLNSCNFIGNLGADPEIKSTGSGARVANLRIAVTEKWKANGENKERTEWVSVVIWSEGLVGVVEKYLRKGSKVYVSGKMQTRKWSDQSGNDRYSTEIVLQGFDAKLVMLDGAKGEGGANHGGSTQRNAALSGFDDGLDDDEVPW